MMMTDVPPEFGVSIVQVNGHVSARVTGELDLATAPDLRQRLEAVIDAGTGDLKLDLAEVTFLDSSGLVVLLAARQRLHDTNRRLTVLHASRSVHRVFEVSGLLDVLDVRPDDGAAVD
jgi:anti-anti-sigma factor